MSCEIIQTIDFANFLAERGTTRFDTFRAHYPRCSACSREVARWSQLQAALGEHDPHAPEHPAEERLATFASRPDALEETTRDEISTHLEDCRACRSELRLLRDFDLAARVRATAIPRPAEEASPRRRLREALRTLAEAASSWLREPALAAVAAALVVAAAGWLWLRGPDLEIGPSPAQRHTQASPAAPVEIAGESEAPRASVDALEERALARRPDAAEVSIPATPPTRAEGPRLADAKPAPSTGAIRGGEPEASPAEATPESLPGTIRIAALLPETPIAYASPASPLPGMGPVRRFGVSRAHGPSPSLEVRVMAPEHVGWTTEASPTLYWQLSETTELPLEVTLVDDAQIEPLLEERRAGPQAAGLHALSLADLGLRLEPGVVYRWQVAVVADPRRRSKDVRSAAAVVWMAPSDAPPPSSPARAHQLAAAGYWYDAFAQLSAWLSNEPDAPNLRAAREALLVQVGLAEAGHGRER